MRGMIIKSLAVATWLILGVTTAEAQMFGTSEVMSEDLHDFKKWNRVLERFYEQEQEQGPAFQQWQRELAQFEGLSDKAKIAAVHKYVQAKFKYRSDYKVWGKTDYWATPVESFEMGYGDCDDFAIAKYFTLKALGFDERNMRVVILRDNIKQEIHAVLTVDLAEQVYVLDNQQRSVKTDSELASYQPIYSINGRGWWKHS